MSNERESGQKVVIKWLYKYHLSLLICQDVQQPTCWVDAFTIFFELMFEDTHPFIRHIEWNPRLYTSHTISLFLFLIVGI